MAARLRRLPVAARAGLGALAAALVLLVAILALTGGTAPLPGVAAPPPAALADPVPYDGRTPALAAGSEQRVLVQFRRPALGLLENARALGAAEQAKQIKSLKREAIATRSAIEARGIRLRDVVAFYRVWNGFAATVRTRDLGRLNSRGTRVRVVRRLYPASGEPVPVGGALRLPPAPAPGQPPVAILDTGVDLGAVKAFADPGYDAVDRDRRPAAGRDPAGGRRRETSATALAGVVAAAGERVLPIRVASLRATGGAVEASATTDTLLAGLEHAVDPNGDLDTSDHVPVVLSGVNSPYASFAHSPEAQAVEGAAGLGTLVVAPAGNEGAAEAGSGTVGSPAGAPDAVAVGALAGPEPAARVRVKAGGVEVDAAALGGTPPASGTLAGPVGDTDAAALGRRQTALRGKVVLVRAGANPAAQAAAAAAVGASAVLLADPGNRPLPAMAAGRAAAPVIGATGAGATALLALAPGTAVSFGAPRRGPRSDAPARHASVYASQGPSAGGLPKPDLAAPGSAVTLGAGGAAVVAGGSAIAAARVAVEAAGLARTRPDLSPARLRALLIAAADPAGLPAARAGAGALRAPAASPGVTADPPTAVSGALDPIRLKLAAAASVTLTLRATGGAAVLPPTLALTPGAPAAVTVRLPRAGTAYGRLEAAANGRVVASVPWLVRPAEVPDVPLGALTLATGRVRFTVGGFERGDPLAGGTSIDLAERLVLDLVRAAGGRVQRSLTPPGGARDLMPAEYAYTLPAATLDALPAGRYRFRARAWAPGQSEPTTRVSKAFRR